MNLSGEAVQALVRFYQIALEDLLVIYDELDLPFGVLRLRSKGGAGGHNGMRSIIQHLGQEFPRLRIGIGRPPGQLPPADYVLQDFGRDKTQILGELLDGAVRAVESFLVDGIDLAMTRHNGAS
jgi:PTH1 family peptidyl-tRNA hydrolase